MKITLGLLLVCALFSFGCSNKKATITSTTTSITTGAVTEVQVPVDSYTFTDAESQRAIVTSSVLDVQEVGGGMCMVYVHGGIGPTGVYVVFASTQLGLKKGQVVHYRYGQVQFRNIEGQNVPVVLSDAEVKGLLAKGWTVQE